MAEQNDRGIQPTAGLSASSTTIQNIPPSGQDADSIPLPPTASASVPIAAEKPPASLERMEALTRVLLLVLTFLVSSFAATNSDVWLHLASGQRIAQREWTIGVDPFSFATEATPNRPAVPWIQHSWLYSWLFYLLYHLVGGAGLVVLKALAVVALAWCLLQIPGGKATRFMSVIYVGLAILALSPQLFLRPAVISFLFFGITLLLCYRAGALGNMPPNPRMVWRLPLLFMLWANLDVWFIMGPLTVALLWAGTGLGALLGIRSTFPGKTLGAVLGVGLLACVVNPHHVRVFMLPPELAYLLVRTVEVPDFLGAGGRALQHLQLDPDFYPLLSPLMRRHWGSPSTGGGQNIAGLAYYPLLLLGLISFVVNAVVTRKPGAPGLHPGRFVLWTFLAFLSLLQARLIPWFAVATAPITLLNLVDWRAWLTNVQVPIQVPNWRPAQLGRALAVLVFLVLLGFAWPGWLNAGIGEAVSPRRVAWTMPVDPSHHGAAVRLAEMNKDGRGAHIFNFSPEIANYCAWYAPGVKYFLDARWSLFPDESARFVKTRMGLSANLPEAWQKTFSERKVDYLVLGNFHQLKRDAALATQLWLDETHWLQKYADGRTLIFAWSGPAKTFANEFRAELSQRAFGKVPEDQRCPAKAPAFPQEEQSSWSQYAEGQQPMPLAAQEAELWLRYHQTMARAWLPAFSVASLVARGSEPLSQGTFSTTLPYTLITLDVIPNKIYARQFPKNGKFFLKARDFGPPAAPLLMIRCARRAVADNPHHPRVYMVLADACNALLSHQEDHWTNYGGDQATGMRFSIRRMQIMTALKTYLGLRPEDPDIHETVANMFLQLNFGDAALEHLELAAKHFDQYRPNPNNPQALDFFKKKKSTLEKQVQKLKNDVKKRGDDYALEAASKHGLEKYREALRVGLAQEAVRQLASVKREALQPAEQVERDFWLTQLLLMMGQASYVHVPPELTELRAFHAAALGNYTLLDEALAELEKTYLASRAKAAPQMATLGAVVFPAVPLALVDPTPLLARTLTYNVGLYNAFTGMVRPEAEFRTLRGVMALEYGDTATARKHLEDALRLAGPGTYFPDRALAQRYLELLQDADK